LAKAAIARDGRDEVVGAAAGADLLDEVFTAIEDEGIQKLLDSWNELTESVHAEYGTRVEAAPRAIQQVTAPAGRPPSSPGAVRSAAVAVGPAVGQDREHAVRGGSLSALHSSHRRSATPEHAFVPLRSCRRKQKSAGAAAPQAADFPAVPSQRFIGAPGDMIHGVQIGRGSPQTRLFH
jgi:hypothetical protein